MSNWGREARNIPLITKESAQNSSDDLIKKKCSDTNYHTNDLFQQSRI